ncbi:MAG: TrmH family RNA methyltransferase [Candidatus Vogelbacteria bacterium]|nr:TrmH family RNA methyltransferase [Candidatus Vogelbacteria bacterium]
MLVYHYMSQLSLSLILHNVRSAHNVGAIFRTADAAGVAKIYLTGYTPAPLDRFKRPVKEIAKTALGAEMTVPWEQVKDITELIARFKKEGIVVWALEQSKEAINYNQIKLIKSTALIVGNEVEGVKEDILNLCDQIIAIPMKGQKESLNVSVATGVVVFKLLE